MEDNATIGELIASLIYIVAGLRLIRLSRRSQELPERLLGASLLLMGLGSLLYSASELIDVEGLWTPLNFSGRLAYVVAFVLVAIFTRRVFRPEQRWGHGVVYATALLFASGVGGSAASGDWVGFSPSSVWYWLEWVGYCVPVTWTAVEAMREHLQARRRVRLGLCEPLVCNRMLLWAIFGALQLASNLISLGQYAEYEREGVFTAGWDALYSAVSISALLMMWIAFFPPAAYRRWIDGAARVES
jgi:hypothetical protein